MYARSSEKSSVTPYQLLLELEAEVVEGCNITDGQKIVSYSKHKKQKEKHPDGNELPTKVQIQTQQRRWYYRVLYCSIAPSK
jgi:hypothetical protein